MSVNFKALGGLLTFRYINDVEDLDLEDLQDMYNDLKEESKELEKCAGDPLAIIRVLENRIENTYPQRKYKMSSFKKVIKSQEEYIKRLQKLLDDNGIAYHTKEPINVLEANGADAIDENAVRD